MDKRAAALARTDAPLVRTAFRTPRAAAIAGVVFSVLLMSSLWLLRLSIPADPLAVGWLGTSPRRVSLAVNLIPFAGIAFMWFLGVLRDRLGAREDQFFATVFLGSGLMFLGMLFVAAAGVGSLVLASLTSPGTSLDAARFAFGRAFTYQLMHTYAFKMAAVFMITTSTLAIRTNFTPHWIAFLGYASAGFLLFTSDYLNWAFFLFPSWVFLVSANILMDNFWGSSVEAD